MQWYSSSSSKSVKRCRPGHGSNEAFKTKRQKAPPRAHKRTYSLEQPSPGVDGQKGLRLQFNSRQ
eukprot:866242-Prorocentrum_minimum.AAC.1